MGLTRERERRRCRSRRTQRRHPVLPRTGSRATSGSCSTGVTCATTAGPSPSSRSDTGGPSPGSGSGAGRTKARCGRFRQGARARVSRRADPHPGAPGPAHPPSFASPGRGARPRAHHLRHAEHRPLPASSPPRRLAGVRPGGADRRRARRARPVLRTPGRHRPRRDQPAQRAVRGARGAVRPVRRRRAPRRLSPPRSTPAPSSRRSAPWHAAARSSASGCRPTTT